MKWPREPHIRPTTDIVREAIFSALEALPVDWSCALDLYAGTGALGIEALSRGAGEADFVEQNPTCCSIIEENLRHTRLEGKATVYRLEVRKALRILKKEYSLIFVDPPYSLQSGQVIVGEIADSGLAAGQSTIVMEHSQKLILEASYGDFQMMKNLRHGDTCVSIFQYGGNKN